MRKLRTIKGIYLADISTVDLKGNILNKDEHPDFDVGGNTILPLNVGRIDTTGKVQLGTTLNPIPTSQPYAILEITIPEGGATLKMSYQGDASYIHVDWGDGTIEDAVIDEYGIYSHQYIEGIYQATFYTEFISFTNDESAILMSGVVHLVNIQVLYFMYTQLSESIDLSESPSLIEIDFSYSNITPLPNLSGLNSLQTFNISNGVSTINELDVVLTTLTESSFTNMSYIDLTVVDNIHPSQPVIDAFVLAHPNCQLILNPEP